MGLDADSRPAFAVDADHLGPSEREWADCSPLRALAPLKLPSLRRAVVVAPHPDDEVLGAGGLLQVLAGRGVAITVGAVTDGEASWGQITPPGRR